MRALRNLRFFAVAGSVYLVPNVSQAMEPHSWCNTGDALVKGSDSDADTNNVIAKVCQGNFAYCCSDGPTDTGSKPLRWDFACVQKAVAYAHSKNLIDGGDHCGRFAWIQGPIRKTDGDEQRNFKQYFPQDFNIVSLAGNIGYLRDIQGPVAASGDVEIGAFNLNYGKRDEIALLAGGKVKLYSGTVHGTVQYGTTYQGGSTVTYVDGVRPTTPTSPSLVDFGEAKDKLIGMSDALRDNYDVNGSASKMWGTVTLTGNDPELNVFELSASQVANTNTYTFKVPAGSAAIITVKGANPVFKNLGFQDAPAANRVLWNFPEATSLALESVAFVGSILAPKAAAKLQNGSIRGTVVVGSATRANVELYSAPLELGCRGGLCLDKTWSCSSDTVMADDGTAAAIVPEAGFLEIEGGDYTSEDQLRRSPKHRVWYSFHPAKFGRKNKPLAVFFQGGPGGGTTAVLFAFGTGPKTFKVVPDPTNPAKDTLSDLVSNPSSWTEFANLLYIDAPATGFSYPMKDVDGSSPDIGNDMDRDASNFLRVLARFLKRHPALQTNRVILVGESYGGVRATMMLQYLYAAAGATFADTNTYVDSQLSSDLGSYFQAAFGTKTPSVAQVAKQFGHQTLIEPNVVGDAQRDAMYNITYTPSGDKVLNSYRDEFLTAISCKDKLDKDHPCWRTKSPTTSEPEILATCDVYNCDKDRFWSFDLLNSAAQKLTSIQTLNDALGVDALSIAWMYAAARESAYGRATISVPYLVDGASAVATIEVASATPIDLAKSVSSGGFGPLNGDDSYLVTLNGRVRETYGYVYDRPIPPGTPPPARTYMSPDMGMMLGSAFARHLHNGVKSFITVTKHDALIWSPAISTAFEDFIPDPAVPTDPPNPLSPYPSWADYGAGYPNDASPDRPGAMVLLVPSGPIHVTMPTAYDSGHSVTMRTPAELRNDVMSWCKNDLMTWYTH